MNTVLKSLIKTTTLSLALLSLASTAVASHHNGVKEKIKQAMTAETRPAGDKARDANRLPVETLGFFGLEGDMTVVEMIPGGGWYTRLLGPVLADKGMLYVAYGTDNVAGNLLSSKGFDKVKVIAPTSKSYRPEGAPRYVLENANLGVNNVDMVLTFRNYHNFGLEGRKAMNDAAFAALKKGGIYGVVDHTRRHMEANDSDNRRRIDPVLAIKEIEAAGFEFVDYSTLHYREGDKGDLEVGNQAVRGKTDRWTLKFKKK